MSTLRRILAVARFDFLTTVRRPSYIAMTLGIPALFLLGTLVTGAAAFATDAGTKRTDADASPARTVVIPIVDDSGRFARKLTDGARDLTVRGYRYRLSFTDDLDAALETVRAGDLEGVLHVPRDFMETGETTYYTAEAARLLAPSPAPPTRPWIMAALLEGTEAQARERILGRLDTQVRVLGETGAFAPHDPIEQMSRWLTPLGVTMFLLIALVASSSYLLQGFVDEKENRVLEILMSSIRVEPLLAGKLLGLGAAGMLQVAVWGAAFWGIWIRIALEIAPGVLALGLAYFGFGYLLLGSLMLGFGAVGSNMRESYQFAAIWIFLVVFPSYFVPVILRDPEGGLARAVALIPFTSPYYMPLRVATGHAAAWEVVVSFVLIAGTTALALVASARLLRVGMMTAGSRLPIRDIARALVRPD